MSDPRTQTVARAYDRIADEAVELVNEPEGDARFHWILARRLDGAGHSG